jgi:hypothetical protein
VKAQARGRASWQRLDGAQISRLPAVVLEVI